MKSWLSRRLEEMTKERAKALARECDVELIHDVAGMLRFSHMRVQSVPSPCTERHGTRLKPVLLFWPMQHCLQFDPFLDCISFPSQVPFG